MVLSFLSISGSVIGYVSNAPSVDLGLLLMMIPAGGEEGWLPWLPFFCAVAGSANSNPAASKRKYVARGCTVKLSDREILAPGFYDAGRNESPTLD